MDKNKQYGLVLDGGGARGAYQMGALRAIKSEGIEIKGVVGTSIGALNGVLFCQGDLDLGIRLWEKMDYSKVFGYEKEIFQSLGALKALKLKEADLGKLMETGARIIRDRGLDMAPMESMIREYVHEDKLRKSGMNYGLVAFNLTEKKGEKRFLEDIKEGELADYLLASCYVPFFQPYDIEGVVYLDGGFYDNSPAQMLVERNYSDLIVIKLGGKLGIQRGYGDPSINVMEIEPREDLGDLLEFDPGRIRYNLQLGFYDAMKIIRGLKGERYYFEGLPKVSIMVERLAQISLEDVLVLKSIWPSNQKDAHRYLFEQAIPMSAKEMALPNDFTYDQWSLALIEYFMVKMGSNRFKRYTYPDFTQDFFAQMIHYKKEQPYEIALKILLQYLLKENKKPKD